MTFSLDGEPVGGMIETPAHVPDDVPDNWSVYFTVADCAAAVGAARAAGGTMILEPTDTPMGPFAVLADPAGAVFQIMEFVEPVG